jgi:hypothetical protein
MPIAIKISAQFIELKGGIKRKARTKAGKKRGGRRKNFIFYLRYAGQFPIYLIIAYPVKPHLQK